MNKLRRRLLQSPLLLLLEGCDEAESTSGSGSNTCCGVYEVVLINNTQYRVRAESDKEERTIPPFKTATFYWRNVSSDWGYGHNDDVVISAVRLNSSGGIVPGIASFIRNKDRGDTDRWELDNGDFKFKP